MRVSVRPAFSFLQRIWKWLRTPRRLPRFCVRCGGVWLEDVELTRRCNTKTCHGRIRVVADGSTMHAWFLGRDEPGDESCFTSTSVWS